MNTPHSFVLGLFFLLSLNPKLHAMDMCVTYNSAKTTELKLYLHQLKNIFVCTKERPRTEELSTMIKKLVREGADPTIAIDADRNGTSAMHFAAEVGDVNLINFLMINGVDIEINDATRNTPMAWAALVDQVDAVAFLVTCGANINARNQSGETVFMKALRTGSQRVIEFLVDKDIEIEACNNKGETALYYAVTHGQLIAATQLIDRGANIKIETSEGYNVLMSAAMHGFTNLVVQFASVVDNIDAKDSNHWTAFNHAVYNNRKEATIALVGMGASISLSCTCTRNKETIELLKSWLSNDELENENWFFTLVRFQKNGSVANVLSETSSARAKSLVSLVYIHGQTPLDVAMASQNKEAVEILLHHGADPLQGILNGLVLADHVPAWHNKNDDGKPSVSAQIYLRHYMPIMTSLPALQDFPEELIRLIIFWLSEIQFQDAQHLSCVRVQQ